MALDRRELRAFLAVADAGSLGRAAAMAYLSQPALSRLVGAMEARLGQPLFERHSKGMTLTAAGEELLPRARLLLFEMEQALEALDALRGARRATARVGAVAAVTCSLMPDAATRLLQTAPDLRMEMLEAPDGALLDALLERRIDVMITSEIAPHADVATLGECRFGDVYAVFAAAGHRLARRAEVSLREALEERWIMPAAGTTPRDLFDRLVAEAGFAAPVVAVETSSLGAMVSFVARSQLLGWLPGPLLTNHIASGAVAPLPVEPLALRRRFFAYGRRRGLLPAAATRLLEALPLLRGDREFVPSSP